MACLWIGAIISNNKKIMLFSYGGEPDTANENLRNLESAFAFATALQPSPYIGPPSRSPTNGRRLVELTGIEPVTSCLQSTRSPS
jgi:hypothetical protein